MPRLSELLAAAGIVPPHDVAPAIAVEPTIVRVDYDSRACAPGSLFVAIAGFHLDGHGFAADAARRGAVAIVAERLPYPPAPANIPMVLVPDTRVSLSALAAAINQHPSRALCVAGVTGTDGKTTTATMLWSAWRAAGINAGALTTIDWRAGDEVTANPSRQTTLEAVELQHHLGELRERGCTHVALETSSHGLTLHRVDDVDFRCAVYTSITSEHLELHGDRAAYLAAKARLLELVSPRSDGIAVLNADDAFAFPRLAAIPVRTRLSYTIRGQRGADLAGTEIRSDGDRLRFKVHTPWGKSSIALRLSGRFNAANALAALAAACATGCSLEGAVRGLENLAAVSGRMEHIVLGQAFSVVIDYAHTAESLATVLGELRESTQGRLWVVFGSAGERDVEKRAAMGAVAARLADVVVITDEDPRDEDRFVILEQIAAGATAAGGRRGDNVVVHPDRAEAIDFAIAHAQPGDTVLCAGKGHEGSLIIGRSALPWNEREVAEATIKQRLSRQKISDFPAQESSPAPAE